MNRDHASMATRRRVEAGWIVVILFAMAAGYGIRVLHEGDLEPGTYQIVPIERVERTAACRCGDRGADQ
ncbi:hypothetical protein GCM10027059_26930 [Myceligenerans halotolerans]